MSDARKTLICSFLGITHISVEISRLCKQHNIVNIDIYSEISYYEKYLSEKMLHVCRSDTAIVIPEKPKLIQRAITPKAKQIKSFFLKVII